MTVQERVIDLVKRIPEEKLPTVEQMLRPLTLPEAAPRPPATEEERQARVRALRGSLPSSGHTVEDFLREKHEDTEREEARLARTAAGPLEEKAA